MPQNPDLVKDLCASVLWREDGLKAAEFAVHLANTTAKYCGLENSGDENKALTEAYEAGGRYIGYVLMACTHVFA
ncbi:hypothetical protein SAMN05192539_103156 [Paraburkholderia diazotrophica]|uniref:Uncharacterized protein n=1 Tax=Paraburkholderia diazotrophica TaxID=667676 RepID=A0A1H7DKJ9_9BURK|nr:hypothetical protein SAMN05192539_103156 [Paraburkholderia diazotrophica]